MRLRRKSIVVAAAAVAAIAARGELARWAQNVESSGPLESVFFRSAPLPGGAVPMRRPPKETRPELTKLIAARPSEADLYALRAREAEEQLDAKSAEADWKQYAALSKDKAAGSLALADFYRRRLRPQEELAALEAAAREPSSASDRLLPAAQQRSWKTFERLVALIDAQALQPESGIAAYRAWMARYPAEPQSYTGLFAYAVAKKRTRDAADAIAAYRKAFPGDIVFPVGAAAQLESAEGATDRALSSYSNAFQPLWPPALIKKYFDLMRDTKSLGAYLAAARREAAANPLDLNAAARLFYYYQQQANLPAAQRMLVEFRQRKERSAWTAEELYTLGQLFEGAHNDDEAAREYYAMYSLPGAGGPAAEQALGALTRLLLDAPDQPIRFGSGDLSLYRDIAAMDPYPGFLNGILSLIFNSTAPDSQYAQEDRAAGPYFHRARAAELLALFDRRFPQSNARPELHGKLIAAYAVYGASDGVIAAGRQFLTAFPAAANRVDVALLMADAYARGNRTREEFAVYDGLLKELATKSDGVPLGENAASGQSPAESSTAPNRVEALPINANAYAGANRARERSTVYDPLAKEGAAISANGPLGESTTNAAPSPARSPEYARVLDRYISRLVALHQVPQALAVYRRELDRNPNDPGLYERLAAFLDQNRLGSNVEQVYRQAMRQFPGRSWSEKLARWYLRHKQTAQLEQLTSDLVKTFSGTELEAYFADVLPRGELGAALYRQLNLYAHRRFPHNLAFVHNLLLAYQTKGTEDPIAYGNLLRENWPYAEDLRDRFFELLSRTNRLDAELAALRTVSSSPESNRLLAEGEAWRCHFETAAPLFRSLETEDPGDVAFGVRAASLDRSLSAFDPKLAASAIAAETRLASFDPRDSGPLTRIGEIYADREQFDKARPYWDKIAAIEPGRSGGYLEAAAVFWDYYRYNDALRVIGEARRQFEDPALFAYEAGAIYENERDYGDALKEYVKGARTRTEGDARTRLLALARRSELRKQVEQATVALVAGANPDSGDVSLRVAVLEGQNRRADLEAFLNQLAARATSYDLLAQIENTARIDGLHGVEARAVEREIAVLADPVERMRRRLALARLYESQGDMSAASRAIDELYRDHPKILGVIRAAVDFAWRNRDSRRAIDLLTEAAATAQPEYRKQFTFEAARKATEAGDYQRARDLLTALLNPDAFHAEYLAAMADTYARQNDDHGLRDFYTAKLEAIKTAPLPAAEHTERMAALRRGLIGVLTRLKDYSGAVDQYIEILNRYPEDESLAREAATYSSAHNLSAKLTSFYQKTAADSPRDYRWALLLARIQTELEDLPAAISAYDRAAAVRPDRSDLFTARAALEQRLLRFDDAVRDYQKLYELTYHNSEWMQKIAEARARQGRTDAAVEALRKARIDGRPDRAANYFEAATDLESWNLLPQARQFAEEGMTRLSDGSADAARGAAIYARVMTRLRALESAWARLASLPAEQVGGAWEQIGPAVERYYAPEEKTSFAAFLEKQRTGASWDLLQERFLPIAHGAGLYDLEARWRADFLMANAGQPAGQAEEQRLIELQRGRMKFAELDAQLESYWKIYPSNAENRDAVLSAAAESYRSAGDSASEIRVLALLNQGSKLNGQELARYAELLLRRQPRGLIALAAAQNSAVEIAVADADLPLALDAIAARGAALPPVWMKAYTALAGLYDGSASPQVRAAFTGALGLGTIGERIGKPVDRTQQIAGDQWFYYGSRYGEYLAALGLPGSEDYLPSGEEATPGRAGAYFDLAEYYRGARDLKRALTEYEYVLQLDPDRAGAHARIAAIEWDQGRRDGAMAEWAKALAAFGRMEDRRSVPPQFWTEFQRMLEDIGARKALPPLREAADKLLRTYVRRNGAYQIDPLFQGAMAAAGNPRDGVTWIADLSGAAADPVNLLAHLVDAAWMPDAERGILYQRLVAASAARLTQVYGEARADAQTGLATWRIARLRYLLDRSEIARAQTAMTQIPEETRRSMAGEFVPLEVRLAAQTKSLDALLESWTRDETRMPASEVLRQAATDLQSHGDAASARTLLAFFYRRELDAQHFDAANFLGLAEILLEEKDTSGAVALLRRMTLVSGEPFENLMAAGELLERGGHAKEAEEFFAARAQAVPWDWEARLHLAAAKQSKDGLTAVALANDAPYATRAEAALDLRKLGGAQLNATSAELKLLAQSGPIPEAAASAPYFYYARVTAAESARDNAAKIRLLLGAVAEGQAGPRVALFQAAIEARRYQLAVSALEPGVGQPLTGLRGAELERSLGEAYEKLGRLAESERSYTIAESLETRMAQKAAIHAALKFVKNQIQRKAANAARRPAIKENLDQDRPVRPKLAKLEEAAQ